jgi:hypothetical protein
MHYNEIGNSGYGPQTQSIFNVITNPRAVFVTADTVDNGEIINDDVKARLRQLADETLKLASKVS